jgi:hypothetical protein
MANYRERGESSNIHIIAGQFIEGSPDDSNKGAGKADLW